MLKDGLWLARTLLLRFQAPFRSLQSLLLILHISVYICHLLSSHNLGQGPFVWSHGSLTFFYSSS